MQQAKLVLKVVFTIFLAGSAFDNAAEAWQKILLVISASSLILFFVSDAVAEMRRGNSSVG